MLVIRADDCTNVEKQDDSPVMPGSFLWYTEALIKRCAMLVCFFVIQLFSIISIVSMEKDKEKLSVERLSFSSVNLPTGDVAKSEPPAAQPSQKNHLSVSSRAHTPHSGGSSQEKKIAELQQAIVTPVGEDQAMFKGLCEIYADFIEKAVIRESQEETRARYRPQLTTCTTIAQLVKLNSQLTDWNGNTPLHIAVQKNHFIQVDWLCKAKVDVTTTNGYGETPLHLALDPAIARCLCEAGAKLDVIQEEGCTPLYNAVHRNKTELVAYLCERGADQAIQTKAGWTPLFCAAVGGDIKIVEYLAKNKDCVHQPNIEGRTPLFAAICNADSDKISCLLEAGAKVDLQDTDGESPLSLAVGCGCDLGIVKALCEKGAPITSQIIKKAKKGAVLCTNI